MHRISRPPRLPPTGRSTSGCSTRCASHRRRRPRQAVAAPPGTPQGIPPREQWHAEPAKVFDNLYLVGQTEYTAWAVVTSDGIIVIDPLFDYSVEDEVVGTG